MPAAETVYVVDYTSGRISQVARYLESVANKLAHPPELSRIFPQHFRFDFSHIRVSVQLSEQRLRYEEARQRERERAAGRWGEEESFLRYARRSAEEHVEQTKEAVVRDWEEVRGDIHNPRLRRTIILGDPGFGKSWLLRYEGYTLAQTEIKRLQNSEIGTSGVLIPIFARLGNLARKKGSLLSRLREILLEDDIPGVEELWPLIEEKAKGGQALLLLDGWDEVREGREELKQALETFVRNNSPSRLYLTSRIAGYMPLNLGGAKEGELVSFSPEQIKQFVHNFFGTPVQPDDRTGPDQEQHTQKGTALLGTLRQQPQVMGLARIPLMLALLCRLYWEKEALPERRVELYDQCLWGLLWRWRKEGEADPIEAEIAVEQKLSFLAALSLQLLRASHRVDAWSLVELTDWVRKVPDGPRSNEEGRKLIAELVRDGVLVREGEGDRAPYRFLHLTFQEYLAAQALAKRADWQEIVRHWLEGYWESRTPVIELLAGELEDANTLIELLLEHHDPFESILLVAARCVAEAKEVWQDRVEEICRRAEQILGNSLLPERAAQSLAWLGKRGQRSFELLLNALHDEDPHIRWVSARALGQAGDSGGVVSLEQMVLHDEVYYVREAAVEALGQLGNGQAVEALRAALDDESWYVCEAAAKALEELGTASEDLLLEIAALRDKGGEVRGALATTLAGAGSMKTLEHLLEALHDENRIICGAAAIGLGQLGDRQAVEPLVQVVLHGGCWVRRPAAEALGQLRDKRAVKPLVQVALHDEDWEVREVAVIALRELGDNQTVRLLLEALHHEKEGVRVASAKALGQLGDRRAVEALKHTALYDEDRDVRRAAALAWGKLGDSSAVEALLDALQDRDEWVRFDAVEALGQLGDGRVAKPLLQTTLYDRNWHVRKAVVKAVEKIDRRMREEGERQGRGEEFGEPA